MSIPKHAPYIRGFADGREIQIHEDGQWRKLDTCIFKDNHEYRFKPIEPPTVTPRDNALTIELIDELHRKLNQCRHVIHEFVSCKENGQRQKSNTYIIFKQTLEDTKL